MLSQAFRMDARAQNPSAKRCISCRLSDRPCVMALARWLMVLISIVNQVATIRASKGTTSLPSVGSMDLHSILDMHNNLRARLSSPSLSWNASLANTAQVCTPSHSPGHLSGKVIAKSNGHFQRYNWFPSNIGA